MERKIKIINSTATTVVDGKERKFPVYYGYLLDEQENEYITFNDKGEPYAISFGLQFAKDVNIATINHFPAIITFDDEADVLPVKFVDKKRDGKYVTTKDGKRVTIILILSFDGVTITYPSNRGDHTFNDLINR